MCLPIQHHHHQCLHIEHAMLDRSGDSAGAAGARFPLLDRPAKVEHERSDGSEVERHTHAAQQWHTAMQLIARVIYRQLDRSNRRRAAVDHAQDRALERGGITQRWAALGKPIEPIEGAGKLRPGWLASTKEFHSRSRCRSGCAPKDRAS
jgi:hypothetical protein